MNDFPAGENGGDGVIPVSSTATGEPGFHGGSVALIRRLEIRGNRPCRGRHKQ